LFFRRNFCEYGYFALPLSKDFFFYDLMGNCVEIFIDHIQKEKRYSSHTVIAYKADIEQFRHYLHQQYDHDDLLHIQAAMVRSWLVEKMGQGMSKASLNRKISSLKSFYTYLLRQGFVQVNPMDKVMLVKRDRSLPEFVNEHDMSELFDRIGFDPDFAGLRDKLVLTLFYTTGMRLSEMTGLLHQDIDTLNQTIRITGKGNKQRIVPLMDEARQVYLAYCHEKQLEFGERLTGPVFVTDKGMQAYPRFIYRRVVHHLGRVTTRRKKSPHVLRHTFATHMLEHGADLNAIKDILGHASLSATQVYTHNTIAKIRSIYKQAHPKA
jgi:integrase/recombinase XerC